MNRLKLLALCFLLFVASAHAKIQVGLTTSKIDDKVLGHPPGKSPIQPPTVFIDAYTLQFAVGHPDYILIIKDEDGETVFTTLVYSAQTEVSLPVTLSGNYEVELVMGNWKFTGYITLL